MLEYKNILAFSSCIRQVAYIPNFIRITVYDEQILMALLKGLPKQYLSFLSALDALGDKSQSTFDS